MRAIILRSAGVIPRALALLAGAAAACGSGGPQPSSHPSSQSSAAPTPSAPAAPEQGAQKKSSCPVTIPPRPGFVPPSTHPSKPSLAGAVWYGTEELWTALDAGGAYRRRKSVWWSKSFQGGEKEPKPDVAVVWRRLDASVAPIAAGSPGTNAFTPQDGWFMIAGVDPPERGCWKVTAKYRGAELEYVYLAP